MSGTGPNEQPSRPDEPSGEDKEDYGAKAVEDQDELQEEAEQGNHAPVVPEAD